MAVGVLRARRQRGGVPSWLIEQGQIDIALDCRHLATLAAPALPPVGQRPGAFGGFPITFIRHNDVRRGQLIAEVVVADGSFIQQLAGIEDAQRGAQIDPGSYTAAVRISRICFGWPKPVGSISRRSGLPWRSRVFSPTCIGRPLTQHHAAAGDL